MKPSPNTPPAIWATIDLSSLGIAPALWARKLIPRNIETEMAPMTARVLAAFLALGRRKAGTPLEMASTPVSAVEPEENACRITNRGTLADAAPTAMVCSGRAAIGHPDKTHRVSPH